MIDLDKIRTAVAGWAGTFHFEDGVLGYYADDCRKGECDCALNECGYTIAEDLEDHIGESLVVLLNAPRELLEQRPRIPERCTGSLVHSEFTYCPVHDR